MIEWNMGNSDDNYDIMISSIGKSRNLSEEFEEYNIIAEKINEKQYIVKNLRPFFYYRFKVKPSSILNWNEVIKSDYIQTKPSVPDFPYSLNIASLNSRNIELIWSEPNDNGSPITQYLIEYNKNILRSDVCNIVIDNLLPGKEYTLQYILFYYRVSCYNDIGLSKPSPKLSFVTKCEEPDCINVFKITKKTDTSVSFSWEEPYDNGCSIDFYYIECFEEDLNDWIILENEYYNTDYLLSNLESGKRYKVRISAMNGLGLSEPFVSDYFTTLSSVPSPVDPPVLDERTQTSLTIHWNYPDDHGSPITQYELYIMSKQFEQIEYNPDGQYSIIISDCKELVYTINNLLPSDIHIFKLRAYNKNGWGLFGRYSNEISTFSSVPDTPSILFVNEINAKDILLEWHHPRCNGYVIEKYEIDMCVGGNGRWKLYKNQTNNTLYYKNIDNDEIMSDLPDNCCIIQDERCNIEHKPIEIRNAKIYDKIISDNKIIYTNTKNGNIYEYVNDTDERYKYSDFKWYEIYDNESGLMYYYNKDTKEVCWEKPNETYVTYDLLKSKTKIPSPPLVYLY